MGLLLEAAALSWDSDSLAAELTWESQVSVRERRSVKEAVARSQVPLSRTKDCAWSWSSGCTRSLELFLLSPMLGASL